MAGIITDLNTRFYAPTFLPKGLKATVDVRQKKITLKEVANAEEDVLKALVFQAKDLTAEQFIEMLTLLVEAFNENKTLLDSTATLTLTIT